MEKMKLINLQGLQTFLDSIKSWVLEKLGSIDTKIDKQIFRGTEAELEIAIQNGLVDENTLIILTDKADSPVYEFSTYEDILNLFPEYKTA